MNDLPISFRPACADDYGFILETFSVKLHRTQPYNFIPPTIYFPQQRNLINSLLASIGALVCHIDDEPNNLVGYLIAEPVNDDNLTIHWGHVKSIYRRLGIMKELLSQFDPSYKDKTLICSHYFDLYKKLKDNYNLIYDPSTLRKFY